MKEIANELDDHRMELLKRVMNVEDHLGVQTGPLDAEQVSVSGLHNDLADGTFASHFTQGSKAAMRSSGIPG